MLTRNTVRHAALVVTSLAFGVAVCELALRLYHPRYEYAADPPPAPQHRNSASSASYTYARNPDTGVPHRLVYNDLGARTSRAFAPESLADSVNIAFFGDSMTENIHMPVQYAFTEHLDYLLNLPAGWQLRQPFTAAKPRFNVLNFGVFGWGTARAYLRWQRVSREHKLHHVFYVYCRNDIPDMRAAVSAGIVRIDESGNVRSGESTPSSLKRLVGQSHLTYLAIDVWRRLVAHTGLTDDEPEAADDEDELAAAEANAVFHDIVLRWKREVEAGGGTFHVVLGPTQTHLRRFGRTGLFDLRDKLNLVNLFECFKTNTPAYNSVKWRFANDPHFVPAANMVVAHCLYRYLQDAFDLPPHTDEALATARYAYYQAFLDSPLWEGERFIPAAPWVPSSVPFVTGARGEGGAIVDHYLALEVGHRRTERDRDIVAAARAAGALAASDWNVFANLPERFLVYASTHEARCREMRDEADEAEPFFLHVYPFTRAKLPPRRRRYGFENLDHQPFLHMGERDGECVFVARLPQWPVARVRTGQFTARDEGGETVYDNHWDVDIAFPLARSVWDVYADKNGRRVLDYVKSPCDRAARQARFFLHVYPLRAADLPSAFARYVNLDFQWDDPDHKHRSYDAAKHACRISAVLPDFPIATIHTGQFRTGLTTRRLWEVRIRLAEVERLAPPAG